MKYFVGIFVFIIVLFFYLHINHHLTKSNDLEVYTIEKPSKDKLDEICNLRQPIIFDYYNEEIANKGTLKYFNSKYSAFDIKIRDITNNDDTSEMYLPLVLREGINVFQNDNDKKYITENNYDFLEETGAIKVFSYNDMFLRPPLVSKCDYDFMSGTAESHTPLRYNLTYRNYFYVTQGSVNVKLIPPNAGKYLQEKKDYDNFEFKSPINPWNVQEKHRNEYEKVKALDVELKEGMILYVPPYWWYSIYYSKMSSICSFKYGTFMNTLSILPELSMYLLQGQNIKREIAPKINSNDKSNDLGEKKPVNLEQKLKQQDN